VVGTLTFNAGVQSAVFASSAAVTFNPGDQFIIVGPTPYDYQLASLATTIIGTLN